MVTNVLAVNSLTGPSSTAALVVNNLYILSSIAAPQVKKTFSSTLSLLFL